MELSQSLHPVGTKFLGFRWQYNVLRNTPVPRERSSLRANFADEEDSASRNCHGDLRARAWTDVFDPSAVPENLLERYAGESQIEAVEVAEYSSSGAFVRLKTIRQDDSLDLSRPSPPSDPDHPTERAYGRWVRAVRMEILEVLNAPDAL